MINFKGNLSGEVKRAGTVSKNELVFKNRSDFPPVGNSGIFYIATDEQNIYYFDTANNSYIPCGIGKLEIGEF